MPWGKYTKSFTNSVLYFSFIAFLFFYTQTVFAASLSLVPQSGNVNVGDNIRVRVVLVSSDKPANAVSGSVTFPTDLLTLNSISKTDSIVTVWPVEPSYSNTTGTINLDGVILSGYQGSNGSVLTLFFRAKAPGSANVKFNNAQVLAHDGQGTPILGSTGQATFNISALTPKVPIEVPKVEPKVDSKPVVTSKTPTLEIEEIKKKDSFDPHSRFFITSTLKNPNSAYKIEIDNIDYVWEGSNNNIFETVPLSRGVHSIKVSFESIDGDIISESLTFNTSGILSPILTDYSNNVKENDFIVIKGVTDPLNYVVINSDALLLNGNNSLRESYTVRANEKGLFTYVSENRANRGVYMISAIARTPNGIESSETKPVKISVLPDTKTLIGKLTSTFSIMIPVVGIFIILIGIIIYGWHRILHYRERMRHRLLETRALVSKSFSILEEDADEEAKILRKGRALKPLTEEEKSFVNQFKKDISSAEKTILNDLKDSDKEI
jgi:hypothetical protein